MIGRVSQKTFVLKKLELTTRCSSLYRRLIVVKCFVLLSLCVGKKQNGQDTIKLDSQEELLV